MFLFLFLFLLLIKVLGFGEGRRLRIGVALRKEKPKDGWFRLSSRPPPSPLLPLSLRSSCVMIKSRDVHVRMKTKPVASAQICRSKDERAVQREGERERRERERGE